MLRIAVELPAELVTPGEFLADVQAYEAAGADAVWLAPAALEPLTLAAAAAAVTFRVGLGVTLPAPGQWPVSLLASVAATLGRLSRGRVALSVALRSPGGEDLVAALRSAGAGPRILVAGADEAALRCAARLGDGLVCGHAEAAGAFRRIGDLRPPAGGEEGAVDSFELWARAPAPRGRADWRELLASCEGVGATGVLVAHAPNLLDILRNPEEDDRQDLAMAVG